MPDIYALQLNDADSPHVACIWDAGARFLPLLTEEEG